MNFLNTMKIFEIRFGFFLALAILALGVYGCFTTEAPKTDLAGTSVSTGNPGSVKISFKEGDSQTVFSGKLEIFGSTQVPLPDLKPGPLAIFIVSDTFNAELSPENLRSIADSAWPPTSKDGDSIYRFNVVASDLRRGTIIRNLSYLKKSGKIISTDSSKTAVDSNGLQLRDAHLVPLVNVTAITKGKFLASYDNYLFILGTGYIAIGDSGTHYTFTGIPSGIHDLKWLTVWKQGLGPAEVRDSLLFYELKSPFNTQGTGVFVIDDTARSTIPIPPNFRE